MSAENRSRVLRGRYLLVCLEGHKDCDDIPMKHDNILNAPYEGRSFSIAVIAE